MPIFGNRWHPSGNYSLVVTTNTAHVASEDTFDDNTISHGLRIGGDAVAEVSIAEVSIAEVSIAATNSGH